MNYRTYLVLFAILSITMVWSGCEKDYYYDYNATPPSSGGTTPAPVSFLNDIYPIFNTNCNLSGCHLNNQNPPDLTSAGIAWDQMWVNDNSNVLIDTLDDVNSILYQRLIKTTSGKMPPSGNLPASQTSLVLKWIQQRAKNN